MQTANKQEFENFSHVQLLKLDTVAFIELSVVVLRRPFAKPTAEQTFQNLLTVLLRELYNTI